MATNEMDAVKRGAAVLDSRRVSPVSPVSQFRVDRGTGTGENGAVLTATYDFLGRFVSYPSPEARVAHALWCAHTHLMDVWDSTPRIAFISPERGSGKTRALEISELLVPRPMMAYNATPAYLFRKVSGPDGLPTILYDEIDALFNSRADSSEDVRAFLNAGHRRGAVAGRCVTRGRAVTTEDFPAYCAVALAGLGSLPETILSRSVIIRMRRRAPTEHIEPYRRRLHSDQGKAVGDRLAVWAEKIRTGLNGFCPVMPDGVEDRDADVWESLLAVADAAGGDWPERARKAAVVLVAESKQEIASLGVRLLTDLRTVFGDRNVMPTEDILSALVKLDESPWSDIKGKPIDARRVSTLLRPYGVTSRQVRVGTRTVKGYTREVLHDSWARYLSPSSAESETSETSETQRSQKPKLRLRNRS